MTDEIPLEVCKCGAGESGRGRIEMAGMTNWILKWNA